MFVNIFCEKCAAGLRNMSVNTDEIICLLNIGRS